jgi:hypothetical protein
LGYKAQNQKRDANDEEKGVQKVAEVTVNGPTSGYDRGCQRTRAYKLIQQPFRELN